MRPGTPPLRGGVQTPFIGRGSAADRSSLRSPLDFQGVSWRWFRGRASRGVVADRPRSWRGRGGEGREKCPEEASRSRRWAAHQVHRGSGPRTAPAIQCRYTLSPPPPLLLLAEIARLIPVLAPLVSSRSFDLDFEVIWSISLEYSRHRLLRFVDIKISVCLMSKLD